ncbi:MAG TPA: hypothetical protein VJT73_20680, partial [Polyangiaceae bacterium]|nr:hypothetical protein [Polyangiaceae bacterium]
VTSPLEVIIEMTDAWEPTSIVSHGVHAGRRRRRRVPPSRRWAAAACTLGLVTVAPTVSMIRPRVTVLYENAILQLARESRRHTSPMPPPSARPRGAQPKDPPLDSTAQR